MPVTRWCGALVVFLCGSIAHANEECWLELSNLPSDTSATTKVNKVLECAAEQGVELNRLRSAIDGAQDAQRASELARDAAIGAVADIAKTADDISTLSNEVSKLSDQILAVRNPWVEDGRSLRSLVENVHSQNTPRTPLLERDVVKYEFAMLRNGGFRTLTFSDWNGGIRVMTNSYIRGDFTENNNGVFALGGSFWIYETRDPNDNCPGGEIMHHYYGDTSAGIRIWSGNGCTIETTIFRRNRHFQ